MKAAKSFTLDLDVLQELEKEKSASEMVNNYFVNYYGLKEKRLSLQTREIDKEVENEINSARASDYK